MEIVGMGTEIVECARIARLLQQHGERFLDRVFTPAEASWCQGRRRVTEHLAARWAAKEAVLKALGLPGRVETSWREVEVRTDSEGHSRVELAGAVRERARGLGVATTHVALAHCRTYATASALLLRG